MTGRVGDRVAPSDDNAVAASPHYVRFGEAQQIELPPATSERYAQYELRS